jgi:DNA-directed RNA polymerase specialized sigma24 family protein
MRPPGVSVRTAAAMVLYLQRQKFSAQNAQESPETAALQRLNAQTAPGLIASLPEPFREMIVLREINDLSYREIADIINAPVGTVQTSARTVDRAGRCHKQKWHHCLDDRERAISSCNP